jgi:hypothetical protein
MRKEANCMSYSIYKYPLRISQFLPQETKILKFGLQNDSIVFWALVPLTDSKGEKEFRFQTFGTGWSIPTEKYIYVDTVQEPEGLVWHIFQEKDA